MIDFKQRAWHALRDADGTHEALRNYKDTLLESVERHLREAYEAGRNDALGITPMAVANRKLCEKGLCVHKKHSEKDVQAK